MKSHYFAGATRRDLLKTIAAAGGATLLPLSELMAQAKKVRKGPGRIDVHHHMLPPFQPNNAGRNYTPEVSLDEMDKFGTESAILSLTIASDYLYDGSDKAIQFARQANEYGAKAIADASEPLRFLCGPARQERGRRASPLHRGRSA